VVGVTSYNPDTYTPTAHTTATGVASVMQQPASHRSGADFDTIHLFVTFSAPVRVDATLGAPYITMATGAHFEVGSPLYKLTSVDPHSLKAPGFNP
jgi:hypothetical protein